MAGICVGLFIASHAHAVAWQVSVDNTSGGAIYKENQTSGNVKIANNWGGFYNKTTFRLGNFDNESFEGDIHYGMFFTSNAKQKLDVNEIEFSTNDMSFWGIDTGLDVGWAFPITATSDFASEELTIVLTPLVGYKWKFMRFASSNLTILDTVSLALTSDDDYNIHCVDVGGRVSMEINDQWEIFAKPIFGIVVYKSMYSSLLGDEYGTFNGGSGLVFDFDTGINYAITENLIFGAMFALEIQRLYGGTNSIGLSWQDTALDVYGGEIRLAYKFD